MNGFDNGDVRANEVVVAFTQDTYSKYTENDVGKTIVSHGGCYGGGSETLIVENVSYGFDPTSSRDVGKYFNEELANTVINGTCAGHKNGVCCVEAKSGLSMQDVTGTIASSISKQTGNTQETVCAVDFRNGTENALQANALQANAEHSLNGNNVVRCGYIVRRLTPMECERLQGFPDGWTDIGEWTDSKGKKHKPADSPRYKALGNSIALPSWKWVLKRISAQYERDATMASLFDGIGGFPLLWEQINGKGACLWASEIEEFPIAVTKFHFGD